MRNINSSRFYTLDKANCIIISVDMQDKILSATQNCEQTLEKACGIVTIANILKIPVISISHCVDKMGLVNERLLNLVDNTMQYTKETFSIFRDPEIEMAISETHKDQLVLFGVETHICLVQSALDARELGYNVFVIEDASSSMREEDKKLSLDRLRFCGVTVLSAQSVAFELAEKAGTEEFKQIFKIAKAL